MTRITSQLALAFSPHRSAFDRPPDPVVFVFTPLPLPLLLAQAWMADTGWPDPDGCVAVEHGDVQLVLGHLADPFVVRVPVLSVDRPGEEYDACAEGYRKDEAHL